MHPVISAWQRKHKPFVVVILFSVIGVSLLMMTRAATPFIAAEAESGSVSAGAKPIDDAAASNAKAVAFPAPTSGGSTVNVTNATELKAALAAAAPGQTIVMADGTYTGFFTSTASGTASAPITLKGGRGAIIDGGTLKSGYTFSLGVKNSADKVSYWKLEGFTLTQGQKGIIFDNVQFSTINNLYVHHTGHEAIHLRNFSSDNMVSNNTVNYAGQDRQEYGEGIYIGTAVSNWGTFSQGKADNSNRNKIIGNNVSYTGAENMDIKEGTHDGVIENNTLSGIGMCPVITDSCNFGDSMIDVKGTTWTVRNNTLTNQHTVWEKGGQENDGIQVHVISGTGSEGSGTNNTFTANKITDVGGYGFNIQSSSSGNIVKCDNTVSDADKGFGNVTCSP